MDRISSRNFHMLLWTVLLLLKFVTAEDYSPNEVLPTKDDYSQHCERVKKLPVSGSSCQNYLYCISTSKGYKLKEYVCPVGFLFDPTIQSCTNSYVCDELTSLKDIAFTTEPDITTVHIQIPVCTKSGKFPIHGSNCKEYLFCILTSTGFKSKQYQCPDGYYFDPSRGSCTRYYNCPETCSANTCSGTSQATVETSSRHFTDMQSSTSPKIDIPECTIQGKFPVPGTNCSEYVLCVSTSSGFKSKTYYCPSGYKFDAVSGRCTNSYVCLESSLTHIPSVTYSSTQTETTSTASTAKLEVEARECEKAGKFAVAGSSCKKYRLCVSTSTGFKFKVYECPSGYYFDPEEIRCSNMYTCSEVSSTINDSEVTADTTRNTEISTTVDDTPEHTTKVDTSSLMTDITTTIQIFTTTSQDEFAPPASTTVADSSEDPRCVTPGRFPIPGSNCRKYILCVHTSSGFKYKLYECPLGYLFDPEMKICSKDYFCFESSSSTDAYLTSEFPSTLNSSISAEPTANTPVTIDDHKTETTSLPRTTKYDEENQNCEKKGKFAVPGSECKRYILCIPTATGMVSKEYKCPENYYFDPSLRMCSNKYTCPESVSTVDTTTPLAINSTLPGSDSTSCPENVKIVEKIVNPLQLAFQTNTPGFLVNGMCTTIGRYLVAGTKCKDYVLCRANADGTLTGVNFSCPTTTVFNQAIQKCSSLYQCPDTVCIFPSAVPNPNEKGCTSYIVCEPNFRNGQVVSYTGTVKYCDPGTYFDPFPQACVSNYVCPTM